MNKKLKIDEFSTEVLSKIAGGAENGSQMEGCFGLAVCCNDTTLKPSKGTNNICSKKP